MSDSLQLLILYMVIYLSAQSVSCVRLFAISWTVTHQAPLSIGFPRQEYCSGLSRPSPRDLPKPGIEPIISFGVRQILYH